MTTDSDKYVYQAPKSEDIFSISQEDGDIFKALPYHVRETVKKNIHEYIQQQARDYLPREEKAAGYQCVQVVMSTKRAIPLL